MPLPFNTSLDVSGYVSSRWLDLNTSPGAITGAEGRMFWDTDNKTLGIYSDITNTSLIVGEQMRQRVYNNSGLAIAGGKIVSSNGVDGSFIPYIRLTDVTNQDHRQTFLGVVAEDIPNNSYGYVITKGTVNNVDLSAFVAGAAVWASVTETGGMQTTEPVEDIIYIGTILEGSVSGVMTVNISGQVGGSSLWYLLDPTPSLFPTYTGPRLAMATGLDVNGLWIEKSDQNEAVGVSIVNENVGNAAYAGFDVTTNITNNTGGGMYAFGSGYFVTRLQDTTAFWASTDYELLTARQNTEIRFRLGNKATDSFGDADTDEVFKLASNFQVTFAQLTETEIDAAGDQSAITRKYLYDKSLMLDQTAPQIVINGAPIFSAGLQTTQLFFDTTITPDPSPVAGLMEWNEDEDTIDLHLRNDVTLQVGQEIAPLVKNQTGSTITNGTPVRFAGAIGASGRVTVTPAIADGTVPSSYILGLVTQDILNGEDGHVTWFGKVRDIDTTGTPYGETWTIGDLLYVSPTTAGGLTNVKPSAPNLQIFIGAVVNVHATQGTIFVRTSWRSLVTDLDDVDGTPLTTTGQIMVWDQANSYFDFTENITDYVKTLDLPDVWRKSDLTTKATSYTEQIHHNGNVVLNGVSRDALYNNAFGSTLIVGDLGLQGNNIENANVTSWMNIRGNQGVRIQQVNQNVGYIQLGNEGLGAMTGNQTGDRNVRIAKDFITSGSQSSDPSWRQLEIAGNVNYTAGTHIGGTYYDILVTTNPTAVTNHYAFRAQYGDIWIDAYPNTRDDGTPTNFLGTDASGRLISAPASDLTAGYAQQLSDLTDVNTSTPTNGFFLIADGIDWESRALVIADVSDFTDNSTNWDAAFGWGDHAGAGYELQSNKGVANGYTPLDSGGKIPTTHLPNLAITDTFVVASQVAMLALTAETGDVAVRTDENKSYILQGTDPSILGDWQELLTPTDAVQSVNGLTGTVTLNLTFNSGDLSITGGNTVDLDTRYSLLGHTHTLSEVTDVTATFTELNLLDLAGLTVGHVLAANGAAVASWRQLLGSEISNDLGWITSASLATIGAADQIPFVNAGGTDFEYSANFTWNDSDLVLYDPTNDGNPTISIGASATERFAINTFYNPATQVLDRVEFRTSTGSLTADDGRYQFYVDDALKLSINDSWVEFSGGVDVHVGEGKKVVYDGDGDGFAYAISDASNTLGFGINSMVHASNGTDHIFINGDGGARNRIQSSSILFTNTTNQILTPEDAIDIVTANGSFSTSASLRINDATGQMTASQADFLLPDGQIFVGTNDVGQGILHLYGAATVNGGETRFYAAADSDTTVDYWRARVAGTTFIINGSTSSTGNLQLTSTLAHLNSPDGSKGVQVTNADVSITGTIVANTVVNEGVAATKILTLDSSDNIDFRTPAELLSDIGGQAAADYLRADIADEKTSGNLTFNDNVRARFGTSDAGNGFNPFLQIHSDGVNAYMDIYSGDLIIRDQTTTRWVFDRDTGNLGIGDDSPSYPLTVNPHAGDASGENIVAQFAGGDSLSTTGDSTVIYMANRGSTNLYGAKISLENTGTSPSFLNPQLDFKLQDNNTSAIGNVTTKLRLKGTGQVQLPDGYGTTTHTGTLVNLLGVDSSGNIIERAWDSVNEIVSDIAVSYSTTNLAEFQDANDTLIVKNIDNTLADGYTSIYMEHLGSGGRGTGRFNMINLAAGKSAFTWQLRDDAHTTDMREKMRLEGDGNLDLIDGNLVVADGYGLQSSSLAAVGVFIPASDGIDITAFDDTVFYNWGGSSYDEIMRIDASAGKVGIGNSSPSAKLDVIVSDGNANSLRLGRSDTPSYWDFNHAGNDLRIFNTLGTGYNVMIGVNASGTDQTNNLSIRTTSASYALNVGGDIWYPNAEYIYSEIVAGTDTRIHGITASDIEYIGSLDAAVAGTIIGNNTSYVQFNLGNVNHSKITSSGNTTTLDVGRPDDQQGILVVNGVGTTEGTNGGQIWMRLAADHDTVFDRFQIAASADDFLIGTSVDVDAIINYQGGNSNTSLGMAGKVGIGTLSPTYKFDVEDTTGSLTTTWDGTAEFHRADGTYNPRLRIRHSSTGTNIYHTFSTGASNLSFGIGNNDELFKIENDGDVHVLLGNTFLAAGTRLYCGTQSIYRDAGDEWLRINPDNHFTNGVYFASSLVRTDGNLQVGSSSQVLITSSGAGTFASDVTAKTNLYLGASTSNLGITFNSALTSINTSAVNCQIAAANSGSGFVAGDLLLAPRTSITSTSTRIFDASGSQAMMINPTGQLQINAYGAATPNHPSGSTYARSLEVDSSGNIVETDRFGVATPTSAATHTLDYEADGPNMFVTLTANTTFTLSNVPDGGTGTILVLQDATGGRTVTMAAIVLTYAVVLGSNTGVDTTADTYSTITYKRFGDRYTYIYGHGDTGTWGGGLP